MCASSRADASTGDSAARPRRPTAGARAVRSTADSTSHDFADAICRAGTQRAVVARKDAGDGRRASDPTAARPAPASPLSHSVGEVEERRQRWRPADLAGGDELRNVEDADGAAPLRPSTRAPSWSSRGRCRRSRRPCVRAGRSVGVALTDVQLELPALAAARGATHHSSSVPTSVTRLSSVTGTRRRRRCRRRPAA